MSYRFHELSRWFWATRGWLDTFARLYLLVGRGACAPCFIPPGNHMGTVGERREPLHF